MCGILGYVGDRDGRGILKAGLTHLEYRGYDSVGVVMRTDGGLVVEKVVGRVSRLEVAALPAGLQGVGHTRWATHGAPTTANAHPHLSCDGRIAVVHNGIIANHVALRRELAARGHAFKSETDTEVVAHLLEETYLGTKDLLEAVRAAVARIEGSFAIVVLHQDHPGELVATRNQSPLVLGVGDREHFIASDVVAFLEHTKRAVFLHDGDIVHLSGGSYQVYPQTPRVIVEETLAWTVEEATLAGYPHFMLKEIHEQPRALRDALLGRLQPGELPLEGAVQLKDLARATDVHFIACGSSHHAGLLARTFFEDMLGVPVQCHLASELTQRLPVVCARPLFIAISQSGETADTLKAVRAVRRLGHDLVALTNVVGSSITREATAWLPLGAGPELSVAATKSFTSQALVLGLLAAHLGHLAGNRTRAAALLEALRQVPHAVQATLDEDGAFAEAGRALEHSPHAYVLAGGPMHAVGLETALKIKEVSYVHAEAFATGEMKHGPLALIQTGTPVLVLAPPEAHLEQALSAMKEVAARGAIVSVITDEPERVVEAGFQALVLPRSPWPGRLFAVAVAGQLVAYHAAVARGCEVDRPRNLAKSVTVE